MFTTTSIATLSLSILAALPSTLAHGYVSKVVIGGKEFIGLKPNQQGQSIVRNIASSFPINDVNDLSTNCGIDAKPAALTAEARPGDEMVFSWAGGDDGNWPHDTGPIIDYIASCDGDCAKFDSQLANWVKIAQVGRKGKGQKWVQDDLFKGGTYTLQLPEGLPNGNYLVRHEVIGLHIAGQLKGVEMYPSCTQIKVVGGKSGSLPSTTVKFPGAYKQDDPGLLINNQFDANADYPFPGPKVASITGGSGGGDPNPTSTEEDPTSTTEVGPSATSDDPTAPATSVLTTKTKRPTATSSNASSEGGDPTSTAEPALITVTEFVTVTGAEPTSAARPTSTITEIETVTITGQGAAPTHAYGGQEDHRIRRSRLFGRLSSRGH